MTSLFTAILVFVAFLVGRWRRSRITHEAPRTIQPSLKQLRAWTAWRKP